ncbi:hypothetical protein DOE51_04945 [Bdellovibrio sp. NC01]|nr:hypothetical protein DOE51_04945 [Bdellovibrio sp. NC01]
MKKGLRSSANPFFMPENPLKAPCLSLVSKFQTGVEGLNGFYGGLGHSIKRHEVWNVHTEVPNME